MCTGIIYVYRCYQCNAVVYKLKEAVKGYTCHQATHNGQRGICKRGIEYSSYNQISDESCLFCEIYLGDELSTLSADNCDEGDEPWAEDTEEGGVDGDTAIQRVEQLNDFPSDDFGAKDEEHDEENDDEEGGAKLH
ncbi:hypothetical protein GQX73_g587 [Xylaria multiplex]|uniref:Uncharacterized protein n=1 Tax=Xylaria multiplex TaxID=323545 RepID=A0A7C8MZ60_9PEZI|nr:hypothetical protein GQX73_g587 [Xylaria multiplex]